ncbi:hypothetical protein EJB05_09513, partial [Eragrostis curvula]
LEGVVRLAESLRKVGAAYQLVVAVLPGMLQCHRDILVSKGCIVREVDPVYHPPGNQFAAMASHYSKLRVWEFVDYERMVYLDANIQVLGNIDELLDLEKGHFYAAKLDPPYLMFVHEPSAVTAKALLDALRVMPPTSFTEQSSWGEMLPQFGRWLTAKAAVFARQNPSAMATLAASSAAVGVINDSAANPAMCFGFYMAFIAAIATITISLRGI